MVFKAKGFNEYEIREDHAIIIGYYKSVRHDILVDINDLFRLRDLGYHWAVKYDPNIDGYYVQTNIYTKDEQGNRKHRNIKIHNVIMDTNNIVDHINSRNTLDNRRSNLRVTTNSLNLKNRKSKNKNNKSGYRNVSLIRGKYIVQLQIDGKNTKLGSFDDVHEAGKFAEEMRKLHYGEYAGKN